MMEPRACMARREEDMKPVFTPGRNIAMKVPSHEHERTVAFYRDVLGFRQLAGAAEGSGETVAFEFGDKVLWIDDVPGISQAELWLEVITDDVERAAEYLRGQDCVRRDGIEPLPDGFRGFWIASPANIIHLLTAGD
jgi:catechol 2,3-dioxygenase-like lactoylglutathione lyase family enzyme